MNTSLPEHVAGKNYAASSSFPKGLILSSFIILKMINPQGSNHKALTTRL